MRITLGKETLHTLRPSEFNRRILVMTAVSAEMEAVLRGLGDEKRFDVSLAGVGSAAAAANTAKALAKAHYEYDLVVSAGIGGGFPGIAEVGSLVVASKVVAADLGVETEEGFTGLDELGLGQICFQVDTNLAYQVQEAFCSAGLAVSIGPVLTVSTVTGTNAGAIELARRIPGAAAEAMEGYGVAVAAADCDIPMLEIRAISNLVGPRDLTKWRVKEALNILEAAGSVLREVLL
ncbi:futalosine hydrolase [Phosphitispora sp. TUW77]|uniref:futalosine hydrolase n=1 Tax=Phosphitispora sp. TUW77 TaxID=3152361 RepID=UPI003AB84912